MFHVGPGLAQGVLKVAVASLVSHHLVAQLLALGAELGKMFLQLRLHGEGALAL